MSVERFLGEMLVTQFFWASNRSPQMKTDKGTHENFRWALGLFGSGWFLSCITLQGWVLASNPSMESGLTWYFPQEMYGNGQIILFCLFLLTESFQTYHPPER